MMIQTLSNLISRQHKAVIFLDESHNVVHRNQLAHSLFLKATGFSIERGQLVNSCKAQNNRFSLLLKRSKNQLIPSTVFWKSLLSSYPVRLDILPVLDELSADINNKPVVMILIDTLQVNKTLIRNQFLEFYNLTPAEVGIVELLVQGLSLNECAKKKSITISTVRWTLSNIFSKTKTRSQKELILIASLFSD